MLFHRKKTFGEHEHKVRNKGAGKELMAKLSRGLMLPIAMLPIAGLFLGIGSAIVSNTSTYGWQLFGNIIKMPGSVIFDNLAVLFAVAIAITFTKDSGTAGLSAVVGWLIFCVIQFVFIQPDADGGCNFLFYQFDSSKYGAIFTNNLGIRSLSTSVFGGIIIGLLVAFLYNKFRNIQLPTIIGFFSGVRFIPIITFISCLLLGLFFCVVWPAAGLGLYYMGMHLGNAPYGINSLVFGIIERSLVPFGLHHAFYAPLWYTSAGGSFDTTMQPLIDGSPIYINGTLVNTWWELSGASSTLDSIQGDQKIWMFIDQLVGKQVHLGAADGPVVTLTFANIAANFQGVNPGQYMQGKYSFMMFALVAAAMAMVMAAPKGENRKQAFSIIGASAITSFLTGITEPLEFTFLFLAPYMFWGFHAILAGISFWLMNLLGAHMGMTFSGGLIDFCIYGVVPDSIGGQANCWIAILIGVGLLPIYYIGFSFAIKRFDIKTPGREAGEIHMFTKADYQKIKEKEVTKEHEHKATIDDKFKLLAGDVILAYGGSENIVNVDACITKLRVQVKDQAKVDGDKLRKLGAAGVIKPSPQSVYAVFGTTADTIKNKMNEILFPNEIK